MNVWPCVSVCIGVSEGMSVRLLRADGGVCASVCLKQACGTDRCLCEGLWLGLSEEGVNYGSLWLLTCFSEASVCLCDSLCVGVFGSAVQCMQTYACLCVSLYVCYRCACASGVHDSGVEVCDCVPGFLSVRWCE